jgi:hypothetical protein
MEEEQDVEHLGNELLGVETDFVEIEPKAPDTNATDIKKMKQTDPGQGPDKFN